MSGKFREGRAELEKVASRMKADGVPISTIAQYTGLSEKAIKAV